MSDNVIVRYRSGDFRHPEGENTGIGDILVKLPTPENSLIVQELGTLLESAKLESLFDVSKIKYLRLSYDNPDEPQITFSSSERAVHVLPTEGQVKGIKILTLKYDAVAKEYVLRNGIQELDPSSGVTPYYSTETKLITNSFLPRLANEIFTAARKNLP